MANMTSSDRAQYERPDLSGPDRTMRVRDRRPVIAYTAVAVLLAAVLLYAVAWGIDGWPQAVVLGVIIVTAIGLMIAVNPTRRT
jgi:fatty acid desaturase